MNHLFSSAQWVLDRRRQRHSELSLPAISLLCHPLFRLATPTFCGTSGRSRMDFVATPPTVQYSRVFVDVTAGRRLQLIPSTSPRDHMPLTLDLVTTGLCRPDPTCGRWDHEKIEDMLSRIPSRGSPSFRSLRQKTRTSTIWGAATDAKPDVAWETLVQIIQEATGPHFYQGTPRPTRPLALERRRLLQEFGTARRLTGASADQTLVGGSKGRGHIN